MALVEPSIVANDGGIAPEAMPAVGDVFGGKYRVERVVGEGGVGYVVAARHLELEEPVALKFLRREYLHQPEVVARFAREAKAAVYVKSEYSAQVFDVGTSDRFGPYIVMELIDGPDLETVLHQRGPMTPRRAVEYVLQACEALAVAHAAGILHRDIKPANLVLTRRTDGIDAVKLVDFGISKSALGGVSFGGVPVLGETTTLVGSPMYMAPEQVRGAACDPRTDIWAVGLVLYELLTGQPAFLGDSIPEICSLILEAPPLPPVVVKPDVPRELDAIVMRCLEKEPEARFANLAELALALLPFAPRRSRLSVERVAAVLRSSGTSLPVALPSSSMPPAPASFAGAYIPLPPAPRLPTLTGLGAPRNGPLLHVPAATMRGLGSVPSTQVTLAPPPPPSRNVAGWLAALALVVVGGAGGFLAVQQAKRAALAEAAAETASAHAAPPADHARVVLIESDPPDALVEWNGLVLGRTPLTASLPVGKCSLAFTQTGFVRETVGVMLTDAPTGADPVRVRAELTADKPRPAASASAAAAPGAAGLARGSSSSHPPRARGTSVASTGATSSPTPSSRATAPSSASGDERREPASP